MSKMQLNPATVGEAIAVFRERKGVTQEVLSGLSDIGRTHLSAIERGERKPTLETLYRISRALDVKMSDIVIAIEELIGDGD
ncbi:MAG: helix-turn-helix transcriptional regulator [Oscillospiraceae bacterium]|jgi:transcriptional regulator with XRE-family HTH domain|nr:helix-turn-helix transcriptional regulator [Oscillospiraceae bacterium]